MLFSFFNILIYIMENTHRYMRQHNLGHFISESHKIEEQRNNNALNSIGLLNRVDRPISYSSINKNNNSSLINNNIIGHGEYKLQPIRDMDSLYSRISNYPITSSESLTGTNTRYMPTADNSVNSDIASFVGFI